MFWNILNKFIQKTKSGINYAFQEVRFITRIKCFFFVTLEATGTVRYTDLSYRQVIIPVAFAVVSRVMPLHPFVRHLVSPKPEKSSFLLSVLTTIYLCCKCSTLPYVLGSRSTCCLFPPPMKLRIPSPIPRLLFTSSTVII